LFEDWLEYIEPTVLFSRSDDLAVSLLLLLLLLMLLSMLKNTRISVF